MRHRIRIPSFAAFVFLVGAAWPIAEARAQPVDPVRQAARTCSSSDVDDERACYQRVLNERLQSGGARAALDLLDRLAAADDDVRRDGHMYAHGIGIAALTSPAEVGTVFATCTPAWQAGCYHGVIQSYFLATRRAGTELTTASVDALCTDYRASAADVRLLFQCVHGLGHGLTMFYGHDLRPALAACDLLSRQNERDNCYGGAFMENIVNVTHPHHVGERFGHAGHASHGGTSGHGAHSDHAAAGSGDHASHAGHGGGAAPAAAVAPWRPLDPDDLHYPCSSVEIRYVDACYTIQTAAMLHHTNGDVGRTAAACAEAPAPVRRTCYSSLGRDISAIAGPRLAEGVRLCGLSGPDFEPACHEGVVASIINMNGEASEGMPYCLAVASSAGKAACYEMVGRHAFIGNGEARREQVCRTVEADYVEACLGRRTPTAGAAAAGQAPGGRR